MRDTADETGTRRRPRSDKGPRLTARDLAAMRWIGEQYAIRFDQLAVLLGRQAKAETKKPGVLSDSATRHTIDRWELAGLAEYKKFLADEPGYVWLTTQGVHAVDLPFKRYVPALVSLAHIYWCAQVRLAMERQRPEWSWQSERWLRAELDQEIKSVKLADAHLHTPQGIVAIEVELTQKSADTLRDILRDRTLIYPQVWYFAGGSAKKALMLARSRLEVGYQDRVKIYELDMLL